MKRKLLITLNICVLAGILIHSIYRDVQLERQYCGDLRNRVVGARLQQDGRLPYFFHSGKDPVIRYYDPANPENTGPSNITASPFFHQLLYPICDLPQATISKIWLWVQYGLLLVISLLFFHLADSSAKRLLMLNGLILFTCTEAWENEIALGQNYLVPALFMATILSMLCRPVRSSWLIAGVAAVAFVLLRPIALIIFLPVIIQYRKFMPFITASITIGCLYGLFIWSSPFECKLWKDYREGLQAQVKIHQAGGLIPPAAHTGGRKLSTLEGIDMEQVDRYAAHPVVKTFQECGNVFIVYRLITKKQLPLWALYGALVLVIAGSTIYFVSRQRQLQPVQTLLFGMLLYMLVEIFSPITRQQYNAVQWLPLLIGCLLLITNWKTPAAILLVAGLVLNIINPAWLPMRHTLGECLWIAVVGLLSLVPILPSLHNGRQINVVPDQNMHS